MGDSAQTPTGEGDVEKTREDELIDEIGRESFPASDPPSWTLGVPRKTDDADAGHDEGHDEKP